MKPLYDQDTIAALATPPGEGGIAIVRISGGEALAVAGRLFSGPIARYASHTAHLGSVMLGQEVIDQALALVMHTPASYTGEDTVELHCHGGMVASRHVLEAALQAGARLARPGEFTFRAFMNGKIDLSQAEAVQQLIGAKNSMALRHAKQHLQGALSRKIIGWQDELLMVAAVCEAWVDFPDEGLEFVSKEELLLSLRRIHQAIVSLIETFEDGKKIFHGISLAIVGEPNVGKSSLLNALVDEERAIVTPIAGTTRDLLHEEVIIGGLTFRLTDTAGLRHTEEIVEQEGIRRARRAMQEADWILAVIDLTHPLPELLDQLPHDRVIVVGNKMDLVQQIPSLSYPRVAVLSARTGAGIEALKELLCASVWEQGVPHGDEVLLISSRHKEVLIRAAEAIVRVIAGLEVISSPEWIAADLRDALQALGAILGQDVGDEVLSKIFSTFCVGK